MGFIAEVWKPNPDKVWKAAHNLHNGIRLSHMIEHNNISMKDSNYLETYFVTKKSPDNKFYLPADLILSESCSCCYNMQDEGHKITCAFERKVLKTTFISNCCLNSRNIKQFQDNHCSDRMYEILDKIERRWEDGCILLIHN